MDKFLKLYKLPSTDDTINVIGVGVTYPNDFPTVFKKGDFFLQTDGITGSLWYATDNYDAETPGEWTPCDTPHDKYYRNISVSLVDLGADHVYYINNGGILSVYTDNLFPDSENPSEIYDFTYNASRMGSAPTITATLNYHRCLDDDFQNPVYTVFNGQVFTIDKTPTSSIANTEIGYKHELSLLSERIVLEHLYFFDVVTTGDMVTQDNKPCSNNTTFNFFGNIAQFAQRLRNTLAYHNIYGGANGYTVPDIDSDVNYTRPEQPNYIEEKLISFEDSTILDALKTMYNTFDVPYYFVGREIHIGYYNQHDWEDDFQYGYDHSLLTIKKNNATQKMVDICSGWGSEENIPYFYPNFTPNGLVPHYVRTGGGTPPEIKVVNPYKIGGCSESTYDESSSSWTYGTRLHFKEFDDWKYYSTTTLTGTEIDNDGNVFIVQSDNFYFEEVNSDQYPIPQNINTTVYGTSYSNDTFRFVKKFWTRIPEGNPIQNPIGGGNASHLKIHLSFDEIENLEITRHYTNLTGITSGLPRRINSRLPNIPEIKITLLQPTYYENPFYNPAFNWSDSNKIELVFTNVSWLDGLDIETYVPLWLNVNYFHYIYMQIEYIYYKDNVFFEFTDYAILPDSQGSQSPLRGDEMIFDKQKFTQLCEVAVDIYGRENTWCLQNTEDSETFTKIYSLNKYGLKLETGFTPSLDDFIYFVQENFIPYFSTRLVPPIYRTTLGERMFYKAVNYPFPALMKYPQGGGTATPIVDEPMGESTTTISSVLNIKNDSYKNESNIQYAFENEYDETRPHEHIERFDNIKPTIKNVKNAQNLNIDMFIGFDYDDNDSDEIDENTRQYIHPYFYAKLRKTNGANGMGFNLFDCGSDKGTVHFSVTSGRLGGCSFELMVNNNGENTVQVDNNGNLIKNENGEVQRAVPQERQNDTENYEVWVCLKKDYDTFGVLMPNVQNNYRPTLQDENKFVLLDITLPNAYILAAEDLLMHEIIKKMHEMNTETFSYSLSLSSIFYANNYSELEQYLNEASKVPVFYNGEHVDVYYVSSYTYKMSKNSDLPTVTVELTEKFKRKKISSDVIISAIDTIATQRDNGEVTTTEIDMPTGDDLNINTNVYINGDVYAGESKVPILSNLQRTVSRVTRIESNDTKEKIWGQIGERVEAKNMFIDGDLTNEYNTFSPTSMKNIYVANKGGYSKEKCLTVVFDKDHESEIAFNQKIECVYGKEYTLAIKHTLVDESSAVDAVIDVLYKKNTDSFDDQDVGLDSFNVSLTNEWSDLLFYINPPLGSKKCTISITVERNDYDTTLKIDSIQLLDGNYLDDFGYLNEKSNLFPINQIENKYDNKSYANEAVKNNKNAEISDAFENISEIDGEVYVINGADVEKYYMCDLYQNSATRTIMLGSEYSGIATHVLFHNTSNSQKTITFLGKSLSTIICSDNPMTIDAASYRMLTFYRQGSNYYAFAGQNTTRTPLSLSNYLICDTDRIELNSYENKTINVISDLSWIFDSPNIYDLLTINTLSGSGNGSTIVQSLITGRDNPSTYITCTASNNTIERKINVILKGKDEFVYFENTQYTTNSRIGTITITGYSNSKRLTFSLEGENASNFSINSTYLVNSTANNNGEDISGDVGSIEQFQFTVTVIANVPIDLLSCDCILNVDAYTYGISDECLLNYTFAILDYDGNEYHEVTIGNQTWLIENLKTTHYLDGTAIPQGNASETTPVWYYPNNSSSNKEDYGLLYNWYTINKEEDQSSNFIEGYHVPNDDEWTKLINYVNNKYSEAPAKSLASTTGWSSSNDENTPGNNQNKNNITEFSAFPSGYYNGGRFYFFKGGSYFWSSSESNVASQAIIRTISYNEVNIILSSLNKNRGATIRLIKDTPQNE